MVTKCAVLVYKYLNKWLHACEYNPYNKISLFIGYIRHRHHFYYIF